MNTPDIITVVRDPDNNLGKLFSLTDHGEVKNDAEVRLAFGIAVQHHVPDVCALEKLLTEIAEDSHAAICNSAFPLFQVGKEFALMSESRFQKMGISRGDPNVNWPVSVRHKGSDYPALGRWKEHSAPSSWVLLDRDVDEHTPNKYADLDYDGWLREVNKLLPGILQCARLRAHSSSTRVSVNGKPVGGGNGHTWVQVANPDDIKRIRSAVKARALDLGMAWIKPRRSKSTGEVVGNDVVSIIDWSVFTLGRLVFAGKPEVHHAV